MKWRAALAGAAVLGAALPAVAAAVAPAFRCRDVVTIGSWQRLPIQRFQPIEGVASTDTVTGYSLAATRPQQVVATNGKRLKVSTVSGCAWNEGLVLGLQPTAEVPLSGTTSTIVSTAALPSGRVLAAVREGSDAASRPHIVGSDDGRTGYRMHDDGLPPQGAPRFLKAADDGRTVYLVLTPTSGGSNDTTPTPVPGLPDVTNPVTGAKTGLLYASTDSGRTWALRTAPEDLPGGGGGLDQLAIDRQDPRRLYAVSNGLLLVSTDGGATFLRARINNDDVTAVETGLGGEVFVFTAGGAVLRSTDGTSFVNKAAPPGVTSAAFRRGDRRLAVERNGRLGVLDPSTGAVTEAPVGATRGSLLGDVSEQATFHALSGHSLLRYIDPPPVVPVDDEVRVGDLGLPPPPPGTITPAARTVQLKVGESAVLDYSLALPKSPTPLDLMFLVDTSGSMKELIADLKRNISKTTATIQRAGIDLQVGLAILGTGAEEGKVTTPGVNSENPVGGAKLYELYRRIGPVDDEFARALARVTTRSSTGDNSEEAQLVALEQATAGLGVRDPRAPAGVPVYLVPPGQDAAWRAPPGIRRLIVHASDEAFAKPAGTRLRNGEPDVQHTIGLMNEYRVKQLGLSLGVFEAREDLARVAEGTRTFAPPGGADCGEGIVLPAGAPLVCDTATDFSAIIGQLVRSLADRQTVTLTARGSGAKVIRNIDASRLQALDVTVPNRLPFRVAVTCKGQSVGRYTQEIVASLRDSRVASTRMTLDCIGPAAVAAVVPPAFPPGPPPPPPPVAQAPAAVVPAPPAAQPQVQPQSQPQVQTQVNPMTAAALQQQQELQLALALQAGLREQAEPGTELAMVGRQRPNDNPALLLLAAAMVASAGLGLARLRSRPDPAVARVRARR